MVESVPCVVIVGGFAGLAAARALKKAAVRITLIDRTNHHLLQPLLYQVATAVLAPGQISSPMREILRRMRRTIQNQASPAAKRSPYFIQITTGTAAIAGPLFDFDTGVISGAGSRTMPCRHHNQKKIALASSRGDNDHLRTSNPQTEYSVKIVEIREKTIPISSPIRNAYIDFNKMTLSLVAVVTDVTRDGKPVAGYGFNSNGRYGQGKLMRERFIPRVLEATPDALIDSSGKNFDPHKIWNTMFTNEKPGGHGERSVAIGTIDMAVWDAVAKIEGKPLFQLLADRYGDGKPNRKIFVYAAGGYYYPGQDHQKLKDEMKSYIDRGYAVVKKKIGGASLDEDLRRIDSILSVLKDGQKLCVDANGRFDLDSDCLRKSVIAVRPVLVRGAGRPTRLRVAGHAA